jgi:hypothetical protein
MNVGKYLRGEDRHVGTARVSTPQQPVGNRCGCSYWTKPKCPAQHCPWQGKRPVDAGVKEEQSMVDPEDWGGVRNVDHIEAALSEERRKFQQETLRTAELSALLQQIVDKLKPEHAPGSWSRECDLCRLVGEAEELLARPVNAGVMASEGVKP